MISVEPPYRKHQQATFTVAAAPDDVFALMCPVAEHDWVPGWKTKSILSRSGLVETDCVFVTPSGDKDATWITTRHNKEKRALTMYKLVPGESVTRLDIAVCENAAGAETTVRYEHTALNEAGRKLVDRHTREKYRETMNAWRSEISDYLEKAAAAANGD